MFSNLLHARDTLRAALDCGQAVADRLFARKCAEVVPKMVAKKPGGLMPSLTFFLANAKAWSARFGVDIDEAPVHFAPCRAIAQRADGLRKGCVGQHPIRRSKRHRRRRLGKLLRQYALQKAVAAAPFDLPAFEQAVEFAHGERREGTRKTCRRAACKDKLRRMGQFALRFAACRKTDGDPVFGLGYVGRAVQPQMFAMAVEISDGHE